MTVYSDQIWGQSQCRKIEKDIHRLFTEAGVPVGLVDAISSNFPDRVVTDNVTVYPHIALYPEFWGSFSYSSTYTAMRPAKLFNCFINRVCGNRQSWFYQFIRRGLLNQGWISYLLDYRTLPDNVATKQELNEYLFNLNNQIFEEEHNFIKDQVPFCNFSGDLDQTIVDSHISVVLETYFDRHETITFSEKTFRALQLPRPVLLYAMPGSIEILRKYGFDVWDDLIDHTYDLEYNDLNRQVLILDQLTSLQGLSYSDEELQKFESRALHNRHILQNLRQKLPAKIEEVLKEINHIIR